MVCRGNQANGRQLFQALTFIMYTYMYIAHPTKHSSVDLNHSSFLYMYMYMTALDDLCCTEISEHVYTHMYMYMYIYTCTLFDACVQVPSRTADIKPADRDEDATKEGEATFPATYIHCTCTVYMYYMYWYTLCMYL